MLSPNEPRASSDFLNNRHQKYPVELSVNKNIVWVILADRYSTGCKHKIWMSYLGHISRAPTGGIFPWTLRMSIALFAKDLRVGLFLLHTANTAKVNSLVHEINPLSSPNSVISNHHTVWGLYIFLQKMQYQFPTENLKNKMACTIDVYRAGQGIQQQSYLK